MWIVLWSKITLRSIISLRKLKWGGFLTSAETLTGITTRNFYWTGLQNQQHVWKLLRLNTIFNKTFSLHHIFSCVFACVQLGGLMHAFLTDTATTCTKWAWNVAAFAGISGPMSLISLPIPLCLHYYLFLVSRPIPSLNYFQPQPDSATVWLPLCLLSFLSFPLLHKTLLQAHQTVFAVPPSLINFTTQNTPAFICFFVAALTQSCSSRGASGFWTAMGPNSQVSQCAFYQRRLTQHVSSRPFSLAEFSRC